MVQADQARLAATIRPQCSRSRWRIHEDGYDVRPICSASQSAGCSSGARFATSSCLNLLQSIGNLKTGLPGGCFLPLTGFFQRFSSGF